MDRRPSHTSWVIALSLCNLVYLYGAREDCASVLKTLSAKTCLFREGHATLDDARRSAEDGAAIARDWPELACPPRVEVVSAVQYLGGVGSAGRTATAVERAARSLSMLPPDADLAA